MEKQEILNKIIERENFIKKTTLALVANEEKLIEEYISYEDNFFSYLGSGKLQKEFNILASLNDEDIIIIIALIDYVEWRETIESLLNNVVVLKNIFSKYSEEERNNHVFELFEKRKNIYTRISQAYYSIKK